MNLADVVQAQITRLQEIQGGQSTRPVTSEELDGVIEALRAALSGEESPVEEAPAEEAPVEEAEAEEADDDAAEEEAGEENLDDLTIPELREMAEARGIEIPSGARKGEIIEALGG